MICQNLEIAGSGKTSPGLRKEYPKLQSHSRILQIIPQKFRKADLKKKGIILEFSKGISGKSTPDFRKNYPKIQERLKGIRECLV